MKFEIAALALIATLMGAMVFATKHAPVADPTARLCENTTGFWMMPGVYAEPGFPDFVPCKFLPLEQDV